MSQLEKPDTLDAVMIGLWSDSEGNFRRHISVKYAKQFYVNRREEYARKYPVFIAMLDKHVLECKHCEKALEQATNEPQATSSAGTA